MIRIGSVWVNPQHVVHIQSESLKSCRIWFVHGHFVTVSVSDFDAAEAVSEALSE